MEDLPWEAGRNVSEGAEALLQGNLRFKGSQCKQVLVTIRRKCILDNYCCWGWACSKVHLSELWGTEAQRSEMELLLKVTFKVSATSPGGQQLEQILSWVFCALFPPCYYQGWISSHCNLIRVFSGFPILNFCCCCSVAKLCPNLCDLMDCSMPGFSVLHYLPEYAQTPGDNEGQGSLVCCSPWGHKDLDTT